MLCHAHIEITICPLLLIRVTHNVASAPFKALYYLLALHFLHLLQGLDMSDISDFWNELNLILFGETETLSFVLHESVWTCN